MDSSNSIQWLTFSFEKETTEIKLLTNIISDLIWNTKTNLLYCPNGLLSENISDLFLPNGMSSQEFPDKIDFNDDIFLWYADEFGYYKIHLEEPSENQVRYRIIDHQSYQIEPFGHPKK